MATMINTFETNEMFEMLDENFSESKRNRAYRRKQKARYDKKMYRNAIDAKNNMRSRVAEEEFNMERMCLGVKVQNPKSKHVKAEKVWARAAKKRLVENKMF